MSKPHTAKEAAGAEMKSVLCKLANLAEAVGQRQIVIRGDDGVAEDTTTVAVLAHAMALIERQYHALHKGPRFVKLEALPLPSGDGRPGELFAMDDRGRVFIHGLLEGSDGAEYGWTRLRGDDNRDPRSR